MDVSIQKSEAIRTTITKTNFTEQRVTFKRRLRERDKLNDYTLRKLTNFLPVSDRNHEIFDLKRLTFPLK